MTVGYIKENSAKAGICEKIKGVQIQSFNNNYVITIINQNKKKALAKYIKKLQIDTLVFSKKIDEKFKLEICQMLQNTKPKILNGKKLMQYMDFEIMQYILNKQGTTARNEDVYIVFKKQVDLDLNFLSKFIANFKTTNIVTNNIERLKNVQENLLNNDGILIAVSNNKRKALKRAKYIINVNLNKEELEKYTINRNSIIVNLAEDVKYSNPSFDGVNINYFTIYCPDEHIEEFEKIGDVETEFDLATLYESKLSGQKLTLEDINKTIEEDGIYITGLIGNNGKISDRELAKIHKLSLDKTQKLV